MFRIHGRRANKEDQSDEGTDEKAQIFMNQSKEKVCKTFIRRFDPDPRLQLNPTENNQNTVTPKALTAPVPASLSTVENGEDAAKRGGSSDDRPSSGDFRPTRKRRSHGAQHLSPLEWFKMQREPAAEVRPVDWTRVETEEVSLSADEFLRFFYSSKPQPAIAQDLICSLIGLLNAGLLTCRGIRIPYGCINHGLLPLDRKYLRSYRESHDHKALKLLGICWLRSIGAERAAAELPCAFGSADAYSSDLDIAVECGDTDPARVLMMAHRRSPVAILVLPYFGEEERFYRGMIFSHSGQRN